MSSLNDASIIDDFAKNAKAVYVEWQQNVPSANQARIANLIRSALRNTTVPDFAFNFKNFSNGSGGALNSQTWTLEINRSYANLHALPEYLFKWLCGILYHEARHGEQWFCCAQGLHVGDLVPTIPLSNVGTKTQQITISMGNVLEKVVRAAENTGSYKAKSVSVKKTIKAWYKSVYGSGSAHRAAVYTMADLFTPGSAGNTAYTSLPEEVDAYATQYAVEAAVGLQITGVTQIVVAEKQAVSTLTAVHQPPTIPQPAKVTAPVSKNTVSSLAALFGK